MPSAAAQPTPADDFMPDNGELALCAQMNFATVARLAPSVGAHPIWIMAKAQLDALVARLTAAEG